MKKIRIVLATMVAISAMSFGGIFNKVDVSADFKYGLTYSDAKNWEQKITEILADEAYIEEWYGGNKNTLIYHLRANGIMKEKDFQFLMTLREKNEYDITEEEYKQFVKLVDDYRGKLPRYFHLRRENVKNPKRLVQKIYMEGESSKIETPCTRLKAVIPADDWAYLGELIKANDLTEKQTKKLRKILNKAIDSETLFSAEALYNCEISERTTKLVELDKSFPDKLQRNNINAKFLQIGLAGYVSELSKWGK